MRTMNAGFNGDGEENVGRPQCKRRRIFISRTVKAAKRVELARSTVKEKLNIPSLHSQPSLLTGLCRGG